MHSSGLGTPPGICLPSQCHHKKSYSQPESLSQLRFHHDLPLLASTRMVSRSTGPSLGHYNTLPKRRDLLRQPHFRRFHDNLPLLRLAAWRLSSDSPVRQASLRQWLANLAICRRNSRLNCQARWGKFRKWCSLFHHQSSEPTIPKIAEFLTFLFMTEKAAVSTIKGYRAMLSSVFKFCLQEISSSPVLKDLVRSFEISASRPLHHLPPWDLDKVLEYLSGPPFEPWQTLPFGVRPGRHCSS